MTKRILGLLLLSSPIWAQGVSGTGAANLVTGSQQVSDLQLRAAEGSLSRFSFKSSFSYLGADVGNTADPNQPNPDHLIGNYASKLKGQISGQYRLSANESVNFGGGLSINHPNQDFNNTDTSNPFVAYARASRRGNLQMINSPGITYYTNKAYTAVAETVSAGHTTNFVYGLGESRYSLSLDLVALYNFYSRSYLAPSAKNPYSNDSTATQYNLSYAPGLKYELSDRLNAYCNIQMMVGNPRAATDNFAIPNDTPKANLGLGYRYAKNIYMNPYVLTYPTIMSASASSLNLQTIFSIL